MLKKNFFSKTNIILTVILFSGLFLRVYKFQELFYYGHDQDLASWFVRDVVVNKHLRLIGQETSTQGIFIGPIYYYLLIPFYLLFNMDPIGGAVAITVMGAFSIWSFYFVFAKIFGKKQGLIAAFIYAVSFYTVFNDRDVVPTTPVFLWTAWYFYALNLLLNGKHKSGFLLLGLLVGLIWHINFALVLLLPLIPLAIFLSHTKIKIKSIFSGFLAFLIVSLPLILFEIKHGFLQTKAFCVSLTTNQNAAVSGYARFVRTIHLFSKNVDGLVGVFSNLFPYETTALLFLVLFLFLIYKKVVGKNHAVIISVWLVLYLGFFSIYSKNLSEYYLNGTIFIFVCLITLGISYLLGNEKLKYSGVAVLSIFALVNLNKYFNLDENKSGYLYRKAIVSEIKRDSLFHSYPCIAISYITTPGYELGYRYLFWLENLHVNYPDSGSPVYTIVYPLRDDITVNKTFGHLGLIFPDYEKYNMDKVAESCSGEDSNIADPMWGLTN